MPSVVIYVLSSQTRGSKNLGSATDANVNMERNLKDSVVCGVKGYAQGAPVESNMPAFRGMPSCNVSGMQLVCASYVPKHKLPCPRASLVFAWKQVAALPRLGLWRGDPSACLCTGRCTYGLDAQGHPRWRLARRQPQWCTTSGGLQNTYGPLDALAIVLLTRPCTTVHGVLNILVDHLAP